MKIWFRKIESGDKKYFSKWWRDKDILKLTSGNLKLISDKKLEKYFSTMLGSKIDFDYLIFASKKAIGHMALRKRRLGWYEFQIAIGEKSYWGKGYGTKALKLLIKKTKSKNIYLEVRPDNLRAIRSYEKCGFKAVGLKKYPKNKYQPVTLKMVYENRT